MSVRLVFMGSPDFALPSLRSLVGVYQIAGVVTKPDRRAGRGQDLKEPPVKKLALDLGLSIIQPENLKQIEAMNQIKSWKPDLIVVAAFGQLIRPEVLNLPKYGCINIHASLLPRWRGAAPINAAILHGDGETGITIMKMDEGLDTGPILSQRAIQLNLQDTAGSVYENLSQLGAQLLLQTLPGYLSGKIAPQPQPEEGATYARLLKKEDGRLDFTHSADELARRVRAFNPWPGAFMDLNGAQLKVHQVHVEKESGHDIKKGESIKMGDKPAPGTRITHNNLPAVYSSDGILALEEVQPAGKKPMSGQAFLAGARNWETA